MLSLLRKKETNKAKEKQTQATDKKRKGDAYEKKALQFLQNSGLKLAEKNYRCKFGEIDLIMLDKETLVFVEVRYRKPSQYATALESITPTKQQKIRKTAESFLQNQTQYANSPCRFDAIGIDGTSINWIRAAF